MAAIPARTVVGLWQVEFFRADGIFLGSETVPADTALEAAKATGYPEFHDRERGEKYVLVSPIVRRQGTICTRCGSPRSQCGGESNPHE
jgi:hypothetical protein